MYLVKSIVNTLTDFTILSESEIKVHVGKARRDYGTTNNTLRRLCNHGVLSRTVGISASTGIPSWQYRLKMSNQDVAKYLAVKEEQCILHKRERMIKDGRIQKLEPVKHEGYYIEVNDWQPAELIADWIDKKGYDAGFDGSAKNGAKYFYANGQWGCLSPGELECKHADGVVDIHDLSEMYLREFVERADTRWSNDDARLRAGDYFDFNEEHTVTKNVNPQKSPLTIGDGIAPDGLSCKCLLVHEDYIPEIVNHRGWTVLTFKRK